MVQSIVKGIVNDDSKELLHHPAQSKESEILDRFRCSRCLNDCIDLPKNRTKKINPLLQVESSPVDRYWCLRYLNNCLDTNIAIILN